MANKIFRVLVDFADNNFCCGLYDEDIDGVVLATGKTFEAMKDEFESGLRFHIEGCIADDKYLPEYIVSGDYKIEYELAVPALLRDAERFTTLAALSAVCGINRKQLSHYATGEKKPRPDKREKIINGLHEIGRQALAYH